VVNKQGKIIGTHKGIAYYTIGQRYGFEIDPRLAGLSGGDIPPLYVIDLKPELNKIVVGLEKDLFKNEFTIKNTNWFISPDQDSNLKVQIRHLGKLSKAELKKGPDNCYLVKSEENFRSVMPGQSAVFYRDDLLVGGGLISK
jgi:tRNA-specific 2-thiouridylase